MELRKDRNKKLLMLFLIGFGIIAGLLVLKLSLDSRSRASILACIGQTSITCRVSGDNLGDYLYDVQVIDKSNGLNVVPPGGNLKDSEGSENSSGGKDFTLVFDAGAGDYACHVTAKLKSGAYCEGVDATKESGVKLCQPPVQGGEPTPTIPTDTGGGGGGGGGNDNGVACSCGSKGKLGVFTTFEDGSNDGVTRKYVYWTTPESSIEGCEPDPDYCNEIQVFSDDSPNNPVHTFACVYCVEPAPGDTNPKNLQCKDKNGNAVEAPFYSQHQAKNMSSRDYVVKFKDKNGVIKDSNNDKWCGFEDTYSCPTNDRLSCKLRKPPTQPVCEPGCDFEIDQGSLDSCNIPGQPIRFNISSSVPNGNSFVFDFDDDDNTGTRATSQRTTLYEDFNDSGVYDVNLKCFKNGEEQGSCTQRLEIGCRPDSDDPTPPPTETPEPTPTKGTSCQEPSQPTLKFMCKGEGCFPVPTNATVN